LPTSMNLNSLSIGFIHEVFIILLSGIEPGYRQPR
jgi:hypothetical protein